MKINYNIKDEDIVDSVDISVSPVEYLVISAALLQFMANPNNHPDDRDLAKCMRIVIEQDGEQELRKNEVIDRCTKGSEYHAQWNMEQQRGDWVDA